MNDIILIYSKDVDDFVNQVIDCLDKKFVRFSESDIDEMQFCNEDGSYIIQNNSINSINLEKTSSIWFNGGGITSFPDYEVMKLCYKKSINQKSPPI